MSHIIKQQHLADRLDELVGLHKSSIGLEEVYVCDTCFSQRDLVGCLCGRIHWTMISVVILRLRLELSAMHVEDHNAAA